MNLKSSIESILFIHGEPVTLARLIKLTGEKKKDIEDALKALKSEYQGRGITLIEIDGRWQLATNPEYKPIVEKLMTSDMNEDLSRASLEVLAIVAYKGPVSRANIEYIRGVNSSFMLRNLLIRGLVLREENPKDRRSYVYRVSENFLKHIGLSSLTELPKYQELAKREIELPKEEE